MFSISAESSTSVFFWSKQVSVVGIFEDGVNRQSFKITLHNYSASSINFLDIIAGLLNLDAHDAIDCQI